MYKLIIPVIIFLCQTVSADLEKHKQFFKEYCISCHGPKKAKAKLRLDQLDWNKSDTKSLEVWSEILDQLKEGEMPPEDEKQPGKGELDFLIQDITARFKNTSTKSKVILRRLNKHQYSNTVRDLLKINTAQLNPAQAFPEDERIDGFDNNSEALIMSDFLLSQAIKAARKIVDTATFPAEQPQVQKHIMGETPPKKSRERYFWSQQPFLESGALNLYQNDEKEPGDTRGLSLMSSYNGAPYKGFYDFTFDVASLGRGSSKERIEKLFQASYQKYHSEDLHRLEIYLVSSAKRGKDLRGISRILVDSIDLSDNKRITIKKRYWLNEGWRVQVAFGNGPAVGRAYHYYNRFKEEPFPEFKDKKEEKAFERTLPGKLNVLIEKYNLPRIKVYTAEREGPFYKSWPPQSHRAVYGEPGEDLENVLKKFAKRAFRRPLRDGEMKPYIKLAQSNPEGIRTAVEAILCSADFLYMAEGSGDVLNHYEIASRLSYFLWNTMPDERLFKLAEEKKLQDKKFLKSLVDEMLADRRSENFTKNFVWSWLKLQNTVEMAPDSEKFLDFKRYRIATSMEKETSLFFRYILDQNLPLSTFIDANFTFVNADLARRYGLSGVNTTSQFHKVDLDPKLRRGGLFTHTSVLTASANGVGTSPVLRGIWILENLLGIHPPPPPDDVEIPEIDLRGKYTLKELYAKHRTIESCNSCHKKIDPLGFALENYNAAGVWREKYVGGTKVDATGKMPDGTPFDGLSGLKNNILKRMNLFRRSLSEKLLTYSSGRTMKATDRVIIEALVDKITKENLGLRDLVSEIVTSEIFLNK